MNLTNKYKRYILADRLTTKIQKTFKESMLYYSNMVKVIDNGRILLPAIYFNYSKPDIHVHPVWFDSSSGYVFKSTNLDEKYGIPKTDVLLKSGLLEWIEEELFYSN